MPNAKVIVEYTRNDVKVSGGLYGFKPSAEELGEGNAVYEDALTGQTIEARTLKELMQEIAIPEVEAEYDEDGVLIKSEPKDIGEVVDKEILFSAEKVKRMKLTETAGRELINKYINEEAKYKKYLKMKEAFDNDPSKNPMPKEVVKPPVEPQPFIFTGALRDRKNATKTNDVEAYQIIYDLSGVPDEIRQDYWKTIVKAHARPNYVIESNQSNGDNTVRGFRGKRAVIANNIHVAQDASIHGQLFEYIYDVSDAKYILCDDAKREELKKLGKEDQITYFPNDERAFVPEHGGVFPFAKWMNSRTDIKYDNYREVVLKHVNRELVKAGFGDYPVHSFVSRVQRFKDEEQAEAVRKVHTDLPQSITDYKEDFAELAKLSVDPEQKNASIVNKYNINIREKSKHAIELTTELERIQRDISIMKAAKEAEIENLTLKVEKDKLSVKVNQLTEELDLKNNDIDLLKEALKEEEAVKEAYSSKNMALLTENEELEGKVKGLEVDLEQSELNFEELEKDKKSLETLLTEKQTAIDDKDLKITKLSNELEELDASTTEQINSLSDKVSDLEKAIEDNKTSYAKEKKSALENLRKELTESFNKDKEDALNNLRREMEEKFKAEKEQAVKKALDTQAKTLTSQYEKDKKQALDDLRKELNEQFGAKEDKYKDTITELEENVRKYVKSSKDNFDLADSYSKKMREFLEENTELVQKNRELREQLEKNGNNNTPKNK